jgi:hypothetical protein
MVGVNDRPVTVETAGNTEAAAGGDGADGAVTAEQNGHRPTRRFRPLRWWREIALIVVGYMIYSWVRNQFGSGTGGGVDPGPAFSHAKQIISVERAMGLYFEPSLHQWYLDLPFNGLIRLWNIYYGLLHFVATAGVLIWLYRAAPQRYRLWRNTLLGATMLAVVGFASYSLMPPRLMDNPGEFGGCQIYAADATLPQEAGEPPCDRYDYIDTVAVYGGWASFDSEEMASVSNQYAAMPSMHIGWAMWTSFVLFPALRSRRLKALVVAYPVVTLFVVIITANHFWLDGVGGALALGAGYLAARTAAQWWGLRARQPARRVRWAPASD